MHVIEYGHQNSDVILLLHGGGLSWWNYKEAAEILSRRYRVILPILDGHAQAEHDFTSIEDTAQRIISLIDRQYGGRILLLGGLSLGGQIAAEVLSQRNDICRHAVLESVSVVRDKLTASLIEPSLASSFFLIKQRWFARLQFRYLKIKNELFEQYYADSCAIGRKNMTAFLKSSALYSVKPSLKDSHAKILIIVGEKELPSLRRSAQILHAHLPDSILSVRKGLYHGEFSINHAARFADELFNFLEHR